MSSHMGASVLAGSNQTGEGGNEEEGEENSSMCVKAVRPRLRSADLAGEGRTSNVEQLVRPTLHGKGRWREENRETEEESFKLELSGGNETARQRQRKVEKSLGDGSSRVDSIVEVKETSNSTERRPTCPKPQGTAFTQTSHLNSQFSRNAIKTRSTAQPRPLVGDLHPQSRDSDSFWTEVRIGAASESSSQNSSGHTHIPPVSEAEQEVDEAEDNVVGDEEEGSGGIEVTNQTVISAEVSPCFPSEERRVSRRERSRMKSLRRRQRRRERWRQSQQLESRQSSAGNPSTTTSCSSSEDDDAMNTRGREGFICAVCLDVYFSPYMCHPCSHIFCEPCLRTLAKNSPTNTPCPLCRTVITHVFFQKELNQTVKTFFPKEFLSRKQSFQKASCAKWPLPSCRKLLRIFGAGFQRPFSSGPRRQFPHEGGYHLDAMDFEDDSRGWRFDMDMVIIYIYSANWIIGFFIFCFLCYIFFPSL
uniref:E3 ubiquitin-protein ligase RNF180 n=1 Tax=Nothobranchius pienaari TaxID=704102 RepID=A0A1A8LAG2_9TELE